MDIKNNSKKTHKWEQAHEKFHAYYDELAERETYRPALKRISNGDAEAMEAALCFIECRPYFFRSGYMFKDILHKCQRAPLSDAQKARLDKVMLALHAWQESKKE